MITNLFKIKIKNLIILQYTDIIIYNWYYSLQYKSKLNAYVYGWNNISGLEIVLFWKRKIVD